ncbi:hypothetical protein F8M41_006385 [Gigaspora margarita]|uniref:Uncharacterized protein n=1 Tax=Gigaspora margarita TaxID=4874 RepID=A0A8H3X8J6_GIGMA|nr:hypothetical protein F8M41_006385 [Gigaspora margarita]
MYVTNSFLADLFERLHRKSVVVRGCGKNWPSSQASVYTGHCFGQKSGEATLVLGFFKGYLEFFLWREKKGSKVLSINQVTLQKTFRMTT